MTGISNFGTLQNTQLTMTPEGQWTLLRTLSVLYVIQTIIFFESILIGLQGGNVLGNGTWVNAGGNQGVTYGGKISSRVYERTSLNFY